MNNPLKKSLEKIYEEKAEKVKRKSEWYNLRPILGCAN